MARDILHFDGTVIPVSGTYPYGDIKDNPGGTKVNSKSNSDIQQLMQRMMFRAGITPNNQADNATDGFQLMQALYKLINEEISGLASSVGAGGFTAVLASGLAQTSTPPTLNIANGWFFYNGQFVRFAGGSTSIPIGSNAVYMTIGNVDGLPTATASVLPDTTPDSATLFNLNHMLAYGVGVGAAPGAWISITSFGSGWSGTAVRYCKDAGGRVYLEGSVTTTSGSPATPIFTLPAGYRPAQNIPLFLGSYDGSTFNPAYLLIGTTGGVSASSIPSGVGVSIDFGSTVFLNS